MSPLVLETGADPSLSYEDFLRQKVAFDRSFGFEVADSQINQLLKPHQRDIVKWAVHGGRRAIFARFGLGKTVMQIEILRLILEHEGGSALVVLPLDVRLEFARDAAMLGVETQFIQTTMFGLPGTGLYLTNYESVREGKVDVTLFTAASLDEASVLRDYGSKTFQTFLDLFKDLRFRYVATALPSPNRTKELIHYSGFLGIMDTGAALTRFFQRDSSSAGNLTVYPHKEREFHLWLNTWAVFLQRPSDLGYSDEGYDLPDFEVVWHEISDVSTETKVERDGQGLLYADAALGVVDAARVKRDSVTERVAKAAELVAASPEDRFILWHTLENEREAIEDAFPSTEYGNWVEYKDGHPRALELYGRHYSAYQYADGRERKLFMGPGEKTVLLSRDGTALFGWRKFRDDSGQEGVNCSVFRNEGDMLSSDLVREAMAIAWLRWPGARLYTYVNAEKVESENPGYCFKVAGWQSAGKTKGGLDILEALPDVEVPAVTPKVALQSVFGSQDREERARRVIDFSDGKFRLLATKPSISGSGSNFQRHCHRAIFVGINYSFDDIYQSIHRIHRYLQTERVRIDFIHTEAERGVVTELLEKWKRDDELTERMSDVLREFGLNAGAISHALTRSMGVERKTVIGSGWQVSLNDCVLETRDHMADNSVGMILTSIPFANHYEYTPDYSDFGHTDDNDHFWWQNDYLTPHLYRVLKPGRILAVHVKDRINFGNVTGAGLPTVSPFHAEAIAHYTSHGFDYVGMITVTTDVVRENNQTYRLGYSKMLKDGSSMGVGSPEYVLLFHKPQTDRSKGWADERIVKMKEDYSLARWQRDADADWRSSGDRLLSVAELTALAPEVRSRLFTTQSLRSVYDFDAHVELGEQLAAKDALPKTFDALDEGSWSPWVWTDVNRMLTLNGEQSRRNLEFHICPLQFDIVDRLITRFSNPGELVYDPFGGLGTVPLRARKLGRQGRMAELNPTSYRDALMYQREEDRKGSIPSLFDLIAIEDEREAS